MLGVKFVNKKWLIAIIAAVVVLLIAIPLGIILSIHNSEYDGSFEYQKIAEDDIIYEIARKNTYYDAANKTLEVSLNQDMVNSLIKDVIGSMDLGLPDNIEIKDVILNTKDQRVYINAKYGALNTPLSAKLNVALLDDGITVKADDLKLGKMNAPGFVKKQIPSEVLTYNIKYADFGLPPVFSVKEVKFGTGNLVAYIELNEDEIANLAVSYRDDILKEIDKVKADQSGAVATFLDKLAASEALSENKIKEYVNTFLGDEELVNSAIYFATADDISKYSASLEKGQQKVVEWFRPITSLKFEGSIEQIVDNLVSDEELIELATWFVEREELDGYTNTAKEYTTKYSTAMASLNLVTSKITSGDIDGAVNELTRKDDIKNFLTLFLDENEVEKYASDIEDYYITYNNGIYALNRFSSNINSGDIDAAVSSLLNDQGLRELLGLFIDDAAVDEYADQIGGYYDKYTSAMTALDAVSESIGSGDIDSIISTLTDNEAINEFLAMFIEKEVIDGYVSEIDKYYGAYNRAMGSLDKITAAINKGDIDAVVTNLVDNKDLEEFLGLFLDKESLGGYTAEIEKYYDMYQDYLAQINEAISTFEESVAAIDTKAIEQNAEAFKTAFLGLKDTKQLMLAQVELIDPEGIQELAALWDSDDGVIGATLDYFNPTWEETLKFVEGADETKENLTRTIEQMDFEAVDEIVTLVDDWSSFAVKFVTMLQDKEYQEVADMLVNNKYSDPEMKAFADKYGDGKIELTAVVKFAEDFNGWWADASELIDKLAKMEYEEAYEVFSDNFVAGTREKPVHNFIH